MIIILYLIGTILFSIVLTASVGKDHGQGYFDMIITGLLFTPLMPLFICLSAMAIDKRKQ